MAEDTRMLPLGLEERDRFATEMGGGIPKGVIGVLEGPDGAGKSVVAQRMIYGFLEEGHDVTYVSTELEVDDFLTQMESLDYSVHRKMLHEDLLFLHADVDTGKKPFQKRSTKDTNEIKFLQRMMQAERLWRADVIVIDDFSAILSNDPVFEEFEPEMKRKAIQEFISALQQLTREGKTILLTFNPLYIPEEWMEPFRKQSGLYLEIETDEVGNDVRRNINVKKFRAPTARVSDKIGINVRAGVGVVIENRSVA